MFADALELQERGNYRAVCRLLFPEMERVVRQELMGTQVGTAASLQALRKRLQHLHVAEHLENRKVRALWLFVTLESHFFEKVDESSLSKFAMSSIPNRHACMHGIVDYATLQNSINMLIIAGYTLAMVSKVKGLNQPLV